MNVKTEFLLSSIGVVIGIILTCIGLWNMFETQMPDGFMGVGFTIGGALIGLLTIIPYYYFKNETRSSLNKQQIKVETLAKLPKIPPEKKKI